MHLLHKHMLFFFHIILFFLAFDLIWLVLLFSVCLLVQCEILFACLISSETSESFKFVSLSQGDMKRQFLLSSAKTSQKFLTANTGMHVFPFNMFGFLNITYRRVWFLESQCTFPGEISVSGCRIFSLKNVL